MRVLDIIEKKRDGLTLSFDEIDFLVKSVVDLKVPDYQISAFLMASYINGLNDDEAFNLTKAMTDNGDKIYIKGVSEISCDKHSSGGVGDKLSLIISPILAACGVPVVKMSGRGLGITGGTLDKLESISGFNIHLSYDEIVKQSKDIGIVICSQTKNLAPCDHYFYELRDATSTVDNIPLIASSIMSKKLAFNNAALIIDIKVGKGAFMKDIVSAEHLARLMKFIADSYGRKCKIILTDMNQPIGFAVGNKLEVIEAVDVLKGKIKGDCYSMSVRLAAEALNLIDDKKDIETCIQQCKNAVEDGRAYKKFEDMVRYQGGDISSLDKNSKIKSYRIYSPNSGYPCFDAYFVGKLSLLCGAGRERKEDFIDYDAGIVLNKISDDFVNKGELLYTVYTDKEIDLSIKSMIDNSFKILKVSSSVKERIIEVI